MTRRDWWLGIGALVLAVLLHAALPRYTWQSGPGGIPWRVDRWSGTIQPPMGAAWPRQ